jgi:hypothetical protein
MGVAAMFNARSMAYRGETENQARVYQGKVDKAQGWADLLGGIGKALGSSATGTVLSSFANAASPGIGAGGGSAAAGAGSDIASVTASGSAPGVAL